MQTQRIDILDSLRGMALLGILLMNILYFGLPHIIVESLEVRNEYTGANYYTWWIINGLFEGTMRATFSMLFGASCLLLLNGLESRSLPAPLTPADIHYRRLIWLLLFGMINAFVFTWAGDILYTYAICGLFLFPFRNMKPRGLLFAALVCMMFSLFNSGLSSWDKTQMRQAGTEAQILKKEGKMLTKEQSEALEEWKGYVMESSTPHKKMESKEIQTDMQKGYPVVFVRIAETNFELQTRAFYFDYIWDALTCFFLGMALFKWNVLTGKRSQKFYLTLALTGYLIGIPASYYYLHLRLITHFDLTLIPSYFPLELYQFRRLFLAFGHIGLFIFLFNSGLFKVIFKALGNVGRMAFTNYLMQSIFCSLIFFGYGFGLFGELERYQLYYVVLAIWIFQILFSAIWLHYFRMGPFEWLWRSLTYWKKQPLKKDFVELKS